jgi:putative transcriptional regulator
MYGELSVAPGLLIAMPQLLDPNFYRSVVLMIEHEEEGSFGLIVNRPSELRLRNILDSVELEWQGEPESVAWWGGPVQPETGWVLHEPIAGIDDEDSREIAPGICLTNAPDTLRRLCAKPPKHMRFVLGYSGWGARQLASELAEGAWVNSLVTPELIFRTPAESMWEMALHGIGVEPTSLAPAHGIH